MDSWSLAEVSRLLAEPQHRLIYLCEKGVVIPDLGEAAGRGSSRLFSKRNLLEFALALRLRELKLPVSVVAWITHVLRRFVSAVRTSDRGLDIVDSLRGAGAIDLRIIVKDGDELFFSLARPGSPRKLFGGVPFQKPRPSGRGAVEKHAFNESEPASRSGFGGPEGSRQARIEVSVTEVAKGLRLEG